jgi:hypothetical protein
MITYNKIFIFLELSIILASELENNQIVILSNPIKSNSVNLKAKNTFIEQQKWFLNFKHNLHLS